MDGVKRGSKFSQLRTVFYPSMFRLTLVCLLLGGLGLASPLVQSSSDLALTICFRSTVVEAFQSVESIIVSLVWVG